MRFTESAKAEGWNDNNIDDIRDMMDGNILYDIKEGCYEGETVEKVVADFSNTVAEFSPEELEEIENALCEYDMNAEAERETADYMEELLHHEAVRMKPFMTEFERYLHFGEVSFA